MNTPIQVFEGDGVEHKTLLGCIRCEVFTVEKVGSSWNVQAAGVTQPGMQLLASADGGRVILDELLLVRRDSPESLFLHRFNRCRIIGLYAPGNTVRFVVEPA